jgi:hypothetical protein
VEDRLPAAGPDVHKHAVVGQAGVAGGFGNELEHALRFVGCELRDVPERLDVPLRDDEQVRLGLRIDVADRDEAVTLADVIALAVELAEQAVVRQRGSPPP